MEGKLSLLLDDQGEWIACDKLKIRIGSGSIYLVGAPGADGLSIWGIDVRTENEPVGTVVTISESGQRVNVHALTLPM